jgi:hypothetical protein
MGGDVELCESCVAAEGCTDPLNILCGSTTRWHVCLTDCGAARQQQEQLSFPSQTRCLLDCCRRVSNVTHATIVKPN